MQSNMIGVVNGKGKFFNSITVIYRYTGGNAGTAEYRYSVMTMYRYEQYAGYRIYDNIIKFLWNLNFSRPYNLLTTAHILIYVTSARSEESMHVLYSL